MSRGAFSGTVSRAKVDALLGGFEVWALFKGIELGYSAGFNARVLC